MSLPAFMVVIPNVFLHTSHDACHDLYPCHDVFRLCRPHATMATNNTLRWM